MQSNNTSHDTSARLQRKPIAFEVSIFICSLLPQVSAESADIESSYTFCVRCFNKKTRLCLASSVKKSQVFKVRSKIVGNTLKQKCRILCAIRVFNCSEALSLDQVEWFRYPLFNLKQKLEGIKVEEMVQSGIKVKFISRTKEESSRWPSSIQMRSALG